MTAARIIVPGATVAITKRTNFRKAFLGPWHPLVEQIWLYAIADAQHELEVAFLRITPHVNTEIGAS